MNIIGIDPSITSTGLCVNGQLFNYSYEDSAITKKGNLSKWFLDIEPYVSFEFHRKVNYDNYQEEQVFKLIEYKKVVTKVIDSILKTIDLNSDTIVGIEGYSYGSSAGNLIDLVQFGTLLRNELLRITTDIMIISPSTLKLETCKMVYPPIEKEIGKKKKRIVLEHRNSEGLAGGKFTKVEMLNAIIEKDDWGNVPTNIKRYVDYLKGIEIGKNVPKPHEDVNDSLLIYLYLLSMRSL